MIIEIDDQVMATFITKNKFELDKVLEKSGYKLIEYSYYEALLKKSAENEPNPLTTFIQKKKTPEPKKKPGPNEYPI